MEVGDARHIFERGLFKAHSRQVWFDLVK